jgi:hypothetical protein
MVDEEIARLEHSYQDNINFINNEVARLTGLLE